MSTAEIDKMAKKINNNLGTFPLSRTNNITLYRSNPNNVQELGNQDFQTNQIVTEKHHN